MALISDLIMRSVDPGTKKNDKLNPLKINTTIEDHTLRLSTGSETNISTILKNTPVLLVFIRGTWCPFCRMHMSRLRKWINDIKSRSDVTVLIVSSEPMANIRVWLDSNPMPFIYVSDEEYVLSDYFGTRHKDNTYFQGATFLINSDMTVSLAYTGKRTQKNFDEMYNAIGGE